MSHHMRCRPKIDLYVGLSSVSIVEKERLKRIHDYAIKCRLPESKTEELKEFKVIA